MINQTWVFDGRMYEGNDWFKDLLTFYITCA